MRPSSAADRHAAISLGGPASCTTSSMEITQREGSMRRLVKLAAVMAIGLSVSWVWAADAAGMGPGPSKDPNNGKSYAGSEACKSCHAKQYGAWKNTIHAWMVR